MEETSFISKNVSEETTSVSDVEKTSFFSVMETFSRIFTNISLLPPVVQAGFYSLIFGLPIGLTIQRTLKYFPKIPSQHFIVIILTTFFAGMLSYVVRTEAEIFVRKTGAKAYAQKMAKFLPAQK